ncbi:MAG: hypothetical protein AAF449_16625 [Myxococcota bacterium]
MVNLLTDLGMHNASQVGTGLAFLVLAGAVVSKTSKAEGRSVARAIAIITVCVALVRVKVVNDHMAEAKAKYTAEMAAYNEARANKAAAIADAKADPDLNAKAPYLHRKREARANLEKARAMPLPPMPVRPNTGWFVWAVDVGGAAGIEAATATLIKLLGGACGAPLMFLLAPAWRREEILVEDALAQGIDLNRLDDEARRGLDLTAGTWRGLKLGVSKRRQGALWPTLAGHDRTVFIGSVPARRLAGEAVAPKRTAKKTAGSKTTLKPAQLAAAKGCRVGVGG